MFSSGSQYALFRLIPVTGPLPGTMADVNCSRYGATKSRAVPTPEQAIAGKLRRGSMRRVGKSRGNFRAASGLFNYQLTTRLAYALAHPCDANSDTLGPGPGNPFLRHSLALVLNLQVDSIRLPSKSDLCGLTSCVTMNVRQTFLHETKYGEFQLRGQPFEVLGDAEPDIEAAALRQTLYVPLKC